MVAAWYMQLIPGHQGAADRIGGIPSHLPEAFPVSDDTGQQLRFLAQFQCDGERLRLPGMRFLQIYQDDPELDPLPVIVLVADGARENAEQFGTPQEGVVPHDIVWQYNEDPDEATDDDVDLAKSKAGGTCYFSGIIRPGERLLLQLRQFPAEFNFGGYTMVLALNKDQMIRVALG